MCGKPWVAGMLFCKSNDCFLLETWSNSRCWVADLHEILGLWNDHLRITQERKKRQTGMWLNTSHFILDSIAAARIRLWSGVAVCWPISDKALIVWSDRQQIGLHRKHSQNAKHANTGRKYWSAPGTCESSPQTDNRNSRLCLFIKTTIKSIFW